MNLTDRFAKPYKLVFLSSLRTKKGVELLIETVKKIPSNLVLLDLYGPIRKDFNKNILNVLPNNIAYKGFVRKENVTRVLAKYDLFIFPTFYEKEGFPSVILDAFAAGLPVVASNINFNSEIVKHLRNGFIFDYMSKNALYSTIIQALENVEKLKQISLNNIEDVKQYELKKVLNLVFHDLETICRR
ncbi:MAG: glycosyltransferase family 4 protein [Bacteroidales bacterium]|jgi:glycosyltransferase involved in cell wall biosynthesis|nr:glycosyltransferase family 4 protein [Bacteroidales bacterium]